MTALADLGAAAVAAPFGRLPDGRPVTLHRLTSRGLVVEVLDYGATLHRVLVPDGPGSLVNVALGCPTLAGYLTSARHYFGTTVGRFANRIAHGRFSLDGAVYELPCNEDAATLHGGPAGLGTHLWRALRAGPSHVVLHTTSPAGEMGFPGRLDVEVTYRVSGCELRVDYRATTDAPTVVNLTNHTYWNLAGEGTGSAEGHRLTVRASRYTPVGAGLLPTGEISPVAQTPLDFRTPAFVGDRVRDDHPQLRLAGGYDHNLVLDRPDGGGLAFAARLEEPRSGRGLELHSTEPGLQVYSGNFLDGTVMGTGGRVYRQGDGVALEPQRFPDAPNQPDFPSTVLRPGEVHTATTLARLCPGTPTRRHRA